MMTTEPPIAIELNCETGVETVRPLTEQEILQRDADMARFEAERAAKEAAEAKPDPKSIRFAPEQPAPAPATPEQGTPPAPTTSEQAPPP